MGRYSYDDMPPEGFREKGRGNGKMTAAIASIGVLLTLIAIIIYLLFTPHDSAPEPETNVPEAVTVDPAQPEIIESRERLEVPAEEMPEVESIEEPSIERASGRFQPVTFTSHAVEEGETLLGIAEEFGLSSNTLVQVNKLTETNLDPGMVIEIPSVDGTYYTVEEGDTLQSIAEARNPELTAADLASLNGKEYTAVLPGEEIFIPAPGAVEEQNSYIFKSPLEGGKIVAEFGDLIDGEPINGVVISSTPGSEVRAAAAGSVVDLFLHPKYGRSVTLLHDNGYSTDYYALEQVSVKVSERVEQGDIIGSIGTSNRYFPEPAVVFSIEQNSVPLDPMNLTAF